MRNDRPDVSIIVRTYQSAATLPATLSSLRAQTDVDLEIIVVDSGSSDDTLTVAATHHCRIVKIPRAAFTFGYALNVGAAAAQAPVHVALSSHCVLSGTQWAETAARHIHDGAVGTFGHIVDPDGNRLDEPLHADHDYLLAHRNWGFTNHASAWSAAAWREHPFREDLPASEDKEWSWRATAGGGHLVADPTLTVIGAHRDGGGLRAYHRRLVREIGALDEVWPLEPYPLTEAARDWARPTPLGRGVSRAPRFGRRRLVEVSARWTAGRR